MMNTQMQSEDIAWQFPREARGLCRIIGNLPRHERRLWR